MRSISAARVVVPFALFMTTLAPADEPASRLAPLPIRLDEMKRLHVTTSGHVLEDTLAGNATPVDLRGGCQTTSSHTSADFSGGQYVVQQGFVENEIAAATYTLPAAMFPIKIDLMEMIFATGGTIQQTTTEWSILVWEGTPSTGQLLAEYSSDGTLLPHIVLPPGPPAGVNVQVSVDPMDPEQIFITDSLGSHSFSIGYRIDQHNQQSGDGCSQAPPANANAFPTTDTSGLLRPADNWLRGVNCGPFGCPANGGWARFSTLPGFCRPSGDWVMRATWTPLSCTPGAGACCLPSGLCDVRQDSLCAQAGGLYQGDGSDCAGQSCPQPTGACCFQSTGGCLNLISADCGAAGGVYGGNGTACVTFTCFPQGACCLPNGTCTGPISPTNCQGQGGTFQGNNTSCGGTNCPQPTGACCFNTGGCLNFTQANCGTAGGMWRGLGTNCSQSGVCTSSCGSCADGNCDGTVSVSDIAFFVAAVSGGQSNWNSRFAGGTAPCDFLCANDTNGDNAVTVSDIGAFVTRLTNGTPCGG